MPHQAEYMWVLWISNTIILFHIKLETHGGSPKKEEKKVHVQMSGAEALLPVTAHPCPPSLVSRARVGGLEGSCGRAHWFLLHARAPSILLQATGWPVTQTM